LVSKLVGGDKVGQVDILLRVEDTANETKFRERYGVRERLREGAVTGKLEDAELTELVRAEVLLVVG
jgi:hypothetical protein